MSERTPERILLEEAPIENLASWMIKGLETGDFTPFLPSDHRDSNSQFLRYLHHLAPKPVKDRLNWALASAISSWTPEDSGEVLDGLAFTAAMVRAYQVVEPLINVIDVNKTHAVDSPWYKGWQTSIGVIAGFSEVQESGVALERWLFDDSFDRKMLAVVTNGSARANRHNYPKYATRFLEIEREHSEDFDTDVIIAEMVKAITIPVTAEHIHELSGYPLERFIKALSTDSYKQVKLLQPPSLKNRNSGKIYYCNQEPDSLLKLQVVFNHWIEV